MRTFIRMGCAGKACPKLTLSTVLASTGKDDHWVQYDAVFQSMTEKVTTAPVMNMRFRMIVGRTASGSSFVSVMTTGAWTRG